MKEGVVDVDNLNYESGLPPTDTPSRATPTAYADSKLMNALFALRLRALLTLGGAPPEGVPPGGVSTEGVGTQVFCVSPGWCRTRLHQNSSRTWYQNLALLFVAPLFTKSASKVSRM